MAKSVIGEFPAVDVDTHLNEPAGTWDDIDASFKEQRLQIREEASRRWLCLGEKKILPIRPTYVGEVDDARERVQSDPDGYEKMIASRKLITPEQEQKQAKLESCADTRLTVLREMGIQSALLFPSFGLFWPSIVDNAEVADANFMAWNNWIVQQSAIDPSSLMPVAQFSLSDPNRTVAEIRRSKKMGVRGFFVRAVPYRDLPWSDPTNEPIWDELETSGMPLLLHAAPIGPITINPAWEKNIVKGHVGQPLPTFVNRALPAEAVLSNLIFEGVLERHPKLKIAVLEFGSIWVPSFLQRIDYTFDYLSPRNRYMRDRLKMKPSEYFRRQVRVAAFWSEPLLWLFESAGPEVFLFSSDFPHPEGSNDAVERAYRILDKMPPATIRRFFSANAKELLQAPDRAS
jgi:predicted TIM-barrel fold metal-dependent hydrolase